MAQEQKKNKTNTKDNERSGKSQNSRQTEKGSDRREDRKDGKKEERKQATVVNNTRGHKEITALVIIALGIFLIFSLLGKAGFVGDTISTVLYGLFGVVTTAIMIGVLFVVAWSILRGTAEKIFTAKNCILFGLLLIIISALVHTFYYGVNDYINLKFGQIVTLLWQNKKGGGVVGGAISYWLQILVAKPGALVILIPMALIISMVLFSLSLINFFKKVASLIKKFAGWVRSVRRRIQASRAEEKQKREKEREKNEGPGVTEVGSVDKKPIESAAQSGRNRGNKEDDIEFVSVATKQRKKGFYTVPETQNDTDDDGDEIIPGANDGQPPFTPIEGETEVQEIPQSGEMIPTKIPDKNEDIRLVVCDESLEVPKPDIELLKSVESAPEDAQEQELKARQTAKKLEEVMRSFGIEARVIKISIGSTVTMYELQPQSGVKVARIKNLSDDIALNLAASGIRIEAPIPGKAAIGIEIPNEDRRTVYLKELIESDEFMNHKSKLAVCLGEDISGAPIIADISKMPHLLIAGTTGSGKSVCVNCMIVSLLYRCSPNDVRIIMIDPKVVELQVYNGIPHLLVPVVTEPKKAAAALSWAVQEMENRYKQFAKFNTRDINSYNQLAEEKDLPKLPRIVIIIDELADLMMIVRDSIEESINRIAQKARAAGMHLIVATQRPSVDVITGLIKANIPSRIAFAVSSMVDSKTILDYGGAEKLLGKGDMLFCPVGAMKAARVQGGFVSDGEIEDIVDFLKESSDENSGCDEEISSEIDHVKISEKGGKRAPAGVPSSGDEDELFDAALDIAIEMKQISASFLQRRLGVGYARASRLIDQMEERGYISCRDGNNPRQVLISQKP